MAADAEIIFEISADNKPALSTINDTSNALKKAGKQWESTASQSANSMGSSFTSIFSKFVTAGVIAKAGQALKNLVSESVEVASALKEVQNVVDVTFDEGASKIESWAATAGSQFGLTELQAKQYTSTLGAMMKSAGLAGDQVVEVSTDLAGLAADMASFYNIDFDTAFDKIRSGMSGLSMPLKQLGINMNVANLEAFALAQGITKAYKDMTQGEQIMLRYQYLMQATSDAQGDFARTSDTLANAQRRVETAITQIKSALGETFYDTVADATAGLANLLETLAPTNKKTVIDEINDIEFDKAAKLAQIQEISGTITYLLEQMGKLNTETGTPAANVTQFVSMFTSNLADLEGALDDGSDIPSKLTDITDNLNPEVPTGNVAEGATQIKRNITGLEDKITRTELPRDIQSLVSKLDPAVEHYNIDKGTEAIKDAIDRLDAEATKTPLPSDLNALAGKLNPEVETGRFTGGIGEIESGITGLDQAVKDSKLPEDLKTLAGDLNPPIEGDFSERIAGIAEGANELGLLAGAKWQTFANALGDIGADAGGNLQGVAQALSTNLSGDASKWENMLKAIGANAKAALDAIGDNDGSKTKAFLTNVAEAADDLTTDYAPYWTNLLSALGSNAATAISSLAGGEIAGSALGGIAEGANELGVLAGTKWQGFIDALGGLVGKGDIPTNLNGVANALAKNIGGKANDWEALLQAVGNNLGAVTTAVGTDNGSTASFLEAAAAAADDLGGDYSELWTKLLVALGTNAGAAVTALKDATNVGTNLGSIATGANKLSIGKEALWTALLGTLQQLDGLDNVFSENAAGNVADLAKALSENSPDTTKAQAWAIFLGALQTNPEALTALTQTDAETTAAWLETMADAANKINADDANAWSNLLGTFVEGLPGLNDTEYGASFFDALRTNFLAMGTGSDVAKRGLMALGYSTEDITTLQSEWLLMTKNLVKELPELSSIVNTQTGEIKGGTQAVAAYMEEWSKAQEKQILLETVAKERAALDEKYNDRYKLKVDVLTAQADVERLTEEVDKFDEKIKKSADAKDLQSAIGGTMARYTAEEKEYIDTAIALAEARGNLNKAQKAYDEYMVNYEAALEKVNDREQAVIDKYGEEEVAAAKAAEATEELAAAQSTLAKAANEDEDALKEVETAVKGAESAMKALADYQERVREETASSVSSLITGFNEVISPMTKARNELKSWTDELNETSTTKERREELEKLIEAAKKTENAGPSFQSMQAALNSQLEFMQNYSKELAAARANGISDEILATLSDGSEASYDYLYALNHTLDGLGDEERTKRIQELNDTYRQVQETAAEFTNTLTDQKLTADEEFKSLVKDVEDAVAGLDMGETTYTYIANTLNGIISACNDKSAAVKTAIDGIFAQMQRLRGLGAGAWLNGRGEIIFKNASIGVKGSQANGLDYVPYDGYLALLHQGERIQTAAEADLSRRYSYTQPAFDYNAMGGAIGANIGRGNVYLDGKTVGQVISARQANSYRSLERSGWQG